MKRKYNICLFAGTTEGHRLARFLGNQDVHVTISVATEYGAQIIEAYENETVLYGKLPEADIAALIQKERFDLVIDATHPYASSITGSIQSACRTCSTEYLRLRRGASVLTRDEVTVSDASEAADFLDRTSGNILFTTGSKELPVYKNIHAFSERAYARVLPFASSLQSCEEAGVLPSHIIAMQGPFSEEMNLALLNSTNAKWLVTKDGSDEGGFSAKVRAAKKAQAGLLVIGRPADVEGTDYSGVIRILCDRFGCVSHPEIRIVGIGPGSRSMMSVESTRAILDADCLIGAKRMIGAAGALEPAFGDKPSFEAISPDQIETIIDAHPQYHSFAVLLSGDTGFFSGAKKLLEVLNGRDVQVIPGISSMAYLCSKLHISYEDAAAVSLHGRDAQIAVQVHRNQKLFVLTGGKNDAASICRQLVKYGLGHVKVSIGQNLSYPDELIVTGTAEELSNADFDSLSAMIIENEQAVREFVPGLADDAFERAGEGSMVPMTKSGIRALSLSRLNLSPDAVCWDVGAGTGSVSVEMALSAYEGKVYAIEKRADAVSLLEKNARRFHADNIVIVPGTAPKALQELPAPTHVFIGGSSGNIRDIILAVYEKNREAKIVATAVTLEAVSALTGCLKELPAQCGAVTAVNISRSRQAGDYHLMTAQNPVYIFEFKRGIK